MQTKPPVIWPKARAWRKPSAGTAGTASGSCARTTTSATRSDRRSAPRKDLHRAARFLRSGGHRPRRRVGAPRARIRAQALGHAAWHRAAAAGVLTLLPAPRRDFVVSAGL